jgi:paraquat-inducible protein B
MKMNSNNELEMGVKKHKKNISLVWLAPIVAILITSGMIWKTYIDAGTRITIVIENGDGIREGKTPIMYKGIKVGTVEDIKIKEDDLSKLELTALIDKRAADGVAREGNQFWKVEPKISITEVSGLNTIVTGVYISVMPAVNNQDALHALPFQDYFVALQYTPVDVFNPGLSIIVNTVENGAMAVGAPVLYNEKAIGSIEDKRLSDDNKSIDLYLRIDTDYIGLVREKSAFYKADALDVKASLSGIQVNMASFASFIAGGIVLFNPDDAWLSPQAKDEDRFALYDNYQESAQSSDEIALIMHGHDNIMPEVTKVFYKGVEAGLVKTLKYDPLKDQTSISIRLNNDFRKLANKKAYFWVVKPRIGFDRIDGLDAIVRGNYINFITTDTEAKANNTFMLHDKQPQMEGIRIDVIADDIESIREGAGLFYHNVEIGRVSSYRVNKDRKSFTISLLLRPKYKRLVNTSSMFYHNSGVVINAGFDGVNITTGSLETVLRGGISVETPDFSVSQKFKDKYVLYNSRAELRKAQYLNGKGLALTLVSEQLGSLL